jgi:hypothetical protein
MNASLQGALAAVAIICIPLVILVIAIAIFDAVR